MQNLIYIIKLPAFLYSNIKLIFEKIPIHLIMFWIYAVNRNNPFSKLVSSTLLMWYFYLCYCNFAKIAHCRDIFARSISLKNVLWEKKNDHKNSQLNYVVSVFKPYNFSKEIIL